MLSLLLVFAHSVRRSISIDMLKQTNSRPPNAPPPFENGWWKKFCKACKRGWDRFVNAVKDGWNKFVDWVAPKQVVITDDPIELSQTVVTVQNGTVRKTTLSDISDDSAVMLEIDSNDVNTVIEDLSWAREFNQYLCNFQMGIDPNDVGIRYGVYRRVHFTLKQKKDKTWAMVAHNAVGRVNVTARVTTKTERRFLGSASLPFGRGEQKEFRALKTEELDTIYKALYDQTEPKLREVIAQSHK